MIGTQAKLKCKSWGTSLTHITMGPYHSVTKPQGGQQQHIPFATTATDAMKFVGEMYMTCITALVVMITGNLFAL